MVEELKVYVGSRVRIFGEWHQPTDVTKIPDETDPLADPSALSIRVVEPDGTSTTSIYLTDAGLIKDATGKYHLDYIPDMPGRHKWFWLPTGNAAQPSEGEFYAHDLI